MPIIEIVWRHLLVEARAGHRRWASVSALAGELGLSVSTTHRSLAHPAEIEAVSITPRALVVLDPVQLLILFAGRRRVQRDVLRRFRVKAPAVEVEALASSPTAVLGGFGAVVAHQSGVNTISDYETVLFYGDPGLPALGSAPERSGTEVLVAEADRLLARYGRVTPLCQAYVDLFSLPGWQAARFVEALDIRSVAERGQPVLLV